VHFLIVLPRLPHLLLLTAYATIQKRLWSDSEKNSAGLNVVWLDSEIELKLPEPDVASFAPRCALAGGG
jgi:hypothetical protein